MKTYIANFGQENYLWPMCLDRATIAMFESTDTWPLVQAGDREAYIALCVEKKKTASGIAPTKQVASRWFNLPGIFSSTEGDLWIHREKDELWWTVSRPDRIIVSLETAYNSSAAGAQIYLLQKPAEPWSNKSKTGTPLEWRGLHAKARTFLFTEGTCQELAADNAAYARAVVDGDDLTPWHSRPEWKQKVATVKRSPVTVYSAKQKAAVMMVNAAKKTVAQANGQEVVSTSKCKELGFPDDATFQKYVTALVDGQDGLCALTGLPLQFDGDCDDKELLCSLDRIDSNGHYEPGNLQVVCRFANRWKSNGDNETFRRLIALVRRAPHIDEESFE